MKTEQDRQDLPWAKYARLSRATDGSTEKCEYQLAMCDSYAASKGLPVSDEHVYFDNSLSAWKRGVKRPGWDALMEAAEAGKIAGILVWAVDRFTRRPEDLEKLITMSFDTSLMIEGPRSGRLDLTTAMGKQQARYMALQAASESDNTSERVKAQLERKMKAGKPMGTRTFGYASAQDQDPAEAAILREMAERLLRGESTVAIAQWLNSSSIPTVRGYKWSAASVVRTLKHERYGGWVMHRGERVSKIKNADGTEQTPIFDQETFDRVQTKLTARRRGRRAGGQYWLSGMAECSDCHLTLTGAVKTRHGKTVRTYNCNRVKGGCDRGILAEPVEAAVDEYMIGLLSDPENSKIIAANQARVSDERAELYRERDLIDDDLVDLEVKKATGEMIKRAYDAAQPKLMARRNKIEAAINALEGAGHAVMPYDPAKWGRLTDDERRQVIRSHNVKIEILPYEPSGSRTDQRRRVRLSNA